MKNIITNILGLIFWGFSVYEMLNEAKLMHIATYIIIGGALFLFENNKLQEIISKIINKKIDK